MSFSESSEIDKTTAEQIGNIAVQLAGMSQKERQSVDPVDFAISQGMEILPSMRETVRTTIEMAMLLIEANETPGFRNPEDN